MKRFFLYIILAVPFLFACNPARKLPQGQYLLVKNKLYVTKNTVDPDDLLSYVKQKPSGKQLRTWIRVRIYNGANKGKETKFNNWLKNSLGSEPVILDTSLTDNSVKQLRMYLDNKGYFNSEVRREIVFNYKHRKKQALVKYFIKTAAPYKIRNISYSIGDPNVKAYVYSDKGRTLLRSGEQYDVDKLSAERDRITTDLNNNGYYYFSSEFIRYKIDSALNSHQVDLTIDITDPMVPLPDNPDSLVRSTHKRYYINNVYICLDYNPTAADSVKYDTTSVQVPSRRKNNPPKTYYFVYHKKLKTKPKTLTQQIFIDRGDY